MLGYAHFCVRYHLNLQSCRVSIGKLIRFPNFSLRGGRNDNISFFEWMLELVFSNSTHKVGNAINLCREFQDSWEDDEEEDDEDSEEKKDEEKAEAKPKKKSLKEKIAEKEV